MHSIPKIRVMHVEDTCQKKNSFACLLFGGGLWWASKTIQRFYLNVAAPSSIHLNFK